MLPPNLHAEAISRFVDERRNDAVRLRLVTEADTDFILGLRLDPARNKNLSPTNPDRDAQVQWMRAYARRFEEGKEAYFIVMVDGEPSGTLRVYDYRSDIDSFCWGSWILRPGCPPAATYQSVILIFDVGFSVLKFSRCHSDVRQANKSVWQFHEAMGEKLVGETALDRLYSYERDDYLRTRARMARFTQGREFR